MFGTIMIAVKVIGVSLMTYSLGGIALAYKNDQKRFMKKLTEQPMLVQKPRKRRS